MVPLLSLITCLVRNQAEIQVGILTDPELQILACLLFPLNHFMDALISGFSEIIIKKKKSFI